jgi:DNA-binding NtrC family response regulator
MTDRVLIVEAEPEQSRRPVVPQFRAVLARGAGDAGVAHQRQIANEPVGTNARLADKNHMARYGISRLLNERGELRRLDALEEEAIRFAVAHCRGRMSEVARCLGIGRSTLYRKLKDYSIVPEEAVSP